jgi:hypothetical protein
MNDMTNSTSVAMLDSLESRFGLGIAARLTERSQGLDADVCERLRFAREQALARARVARGDDLPSQVGATQSGAALLGRARTGWWILAGSVLPVFALVAGLVVIQKWQDRTQISIAAEIDAALLSDALPPNAYTDVGFVEFLKTPRE